MKWTKDILDKAKSLKDQDLSYPKIAEKLNKEFYISVSASSVNHALNDYIRGNYHFDQFKSKDTQSNSKHEHRDKQGNIQSIDFDVKFEDFRKLSGKKPEDILRFAGYADTENWVLSNITNNDWSVTNGDGQRYWNHQIKFIAKPKTGLSLEEQLSLLSDNVKPFVFQENQAFLKHRTNLVIPLADLHFGITAFEDVQDKLKEILSIIKRGFNQIVIVQLSDLLHSDQINHSQTVKATQLDDVDMPKAIHDAEKFMFTLIEAAYQNGNDLRVKYVGGNHDFDLGYMFEEMLKIKYPQVDIDVNNGYRNAFTVGKSVGLLIGHGDMGKTKLPMLFATEYPDIWSQSTYREILTGHYHKEQVEDDYGVVLHQLGTPKKTDPYEAKNGYTMSHKKMQLFEYDDETLKDIHYI
ncbi:hypothetical protein AO468_04550 [Oenococcus oeni]|uniref:hypothetical protein n=2 Tax=Oenococcus oeni TaxID=1247 RepID=UPI000BDEE09B|nr:hypothetical protein [Oenococcus oeni]PDH93868.1 hypothetical protein AO468_04550 [Oenococcus oeni]